MASKPIDLDLSDALFCAERGLEVRLADEPATKDRLRCAEDGMVVYGGYAYPPEELAGRRFCVVGPAPWDVFLVLWKRARLGDPTTVSWNEMVGKLTRKNPNWHTDFGLGDFAWACLFQRKLIEAWRAVSQ